MATFTSRTITSTRREWIVPAPAAYAEICKAFVVAEDAYRADRGMAEDAPLADDALTLAAADDAVVISYTIEEASR